jgi:putative flippase GtrA
MFKLRNHLRRFTRFFAVGGTATLIHYVIMASLVFGLTQPAEYASAFGYIVSAIYNYAANAYFTFGGGHSHLKSIPRFFIVAIAGLFFNQVIFIFATSFGITVVFSQLLATGAVLVFNYSLNNIWVFVDKEADT